jgi:hypothetical protein
MYLHHNILVYHTMSHLHTIDVTAPVQLIYA